MNWEQIANEWKNLLALKGARGLSVMKVKWVDWCAGTVYIAKSKDILNFQEKLRSSFKKSSIPEKNLI